MGCPVSRSAGFPLPKLSSSSSSPLGKPERESHMRAFGLADYPITGAKLHLGQEEAHAPPPGAGLGAASVLRVSPRTSQTRRVKAVAPDYR